MNLEQFYCKESGLEKADEYFHLLKSQTEHKGNCTKENYPCLKCEFEDLIHKFLVYKFGEVGINLNRTSQLGYFTNYHDFHIYVDFGLNELIINVFKNKVQIYTGWGNIDDMILELLTIIDKK